MTLKQHIAFIVAGKSKDSLPAIAVDAIKEGYASTSLGILAGLPEHENPYVAYNYFLAAIRELGIEWPEERAAHIDAAKAIVELIMDGKKDVEAGVREMLPLLDYFRDEDREYRYDTLGFARAYGILISIEDVREAGERPWMEGRSNEDLLQDLRRELRNEVGEWGRMVG